MAQFYTLSSETLPEWYQRLYPALVTAEIYAGRPIAGSFALWLWQVHTTGKSPAWTPTDVDIWFSSEADMMRTVIAVQSAYPKASLQKRGPAIVEIRFRGNLPTLQFIHRNTYHQKRKAPFSFLDMFDLSVAQVAITRLDGRKVDFAFGDDDVRSDIASGVCRCFRDMSASPSDSPGAENTTRRLEKYQARGFQVTQGEIRPLAKWGAYYQSKESTVEIAASG